METFYRAFLTPEVSICGFKLTNFSYNHLVILRAINSPFVDPDENRIATSADLITALKVCSSSYPDKDFSFTRRDEIKAYVLGYIKSRLYKECLNFSCYIAVHQNVPQFWEFNTTGWNQASSPDELSTISLLVKNNIPHNEAWNMSIGYVNWYTATVLEQNGNPRIFAEVTEDDDNLINLNDQSEEDITRIAIEQLGEERARDWLKSRKKHKAGA